MRVYYNTKSTRGEIEMDSVNESMPLAEVRELTAKVLNIESVELRVSLKKEADPTEYYNTQLNDLINRVTGITLDYSIGNALNLPELERIRYDAALHQLRKGNKSVSSLMLAELGDSVAGMSDTEIKDAADVRARLIVERYERRAEVLLRLNNIVTAFTAKSNLKDIEEINRLYKATADAMDALVKEK